MTADGAPAPLHPVARELLAEFRELDDMPADARARVRRSLEADADAPARAANDRSGTRSWIVWSLVGAAAGVALLLGLKALAPTLTERSDAPKLEAAPDRADREAASSRASVREDARQRGRGTIVEPETAPVPVPVVEPPPPPVVVVPHRETPDRSPPASPRREDRSTTPTPPPPTPAPASTLDAERRLIAQAWNALAEGDPAAALASATSHRDRFPHGVLAPERAAVEAIARCKRDADDTRARAFLKAHPGSPLAARVRSACAIEASAGSTDTRTPTGR